MALRGTLTHRKVRRLAGEMKIPACYALGVAEALWHVTAEQAANGAIGRMADEDIAMEMFYDGDAAILIESLVRSGLLDRDDEHRLIVHDWHIHSDDATDNKLARNGCMYASGAMPRMRRLSKEEREKVSSRFVVPCESVRTDSHTLAREATKSHYQSPVPDPEPEEQVQKPSRGKRERAPDERHAPFKGEVLKYWTSKNPGYDMPWGPADAAQLAALLRKAPTLTVEQFTGFLRNRFKSQVTHCDDPHTWLASVGKYANGPLDRYSKPMDGEETSNGAHHGNPGFNSANRGQQKTDGNYEAARRAAEALAGADSARAG